MQDDACFSVAADGKTLDFAVPVPVPDDRKSNQVGQMSLSSVRSPDENVLPMVSLGVHGEHAHTAL